MGHRRIFPDYMSDIVTVNGNEEDIPGSVLQQWHESFRRHVL